MARAAGEAWRGEVAAARRAAELETHPGRRLFDGLDVLVDTWQPDTGLFGFDGIPARSLIRRALNDSSAASPSSLTIASRLTSGRGWPRGRTSPIALLP